MVPVVASRHWLHHAYLVRLGVDTRTRRRTRSHTTPDTEH